MKILLLGLLVIVLGDALSIFVAGDLIILIFWSHYNGYVDQVPGFKTGKKFF